jgi:regulator of sirC expression with transglutaminase-like and TPR domain
MPRLASRLLLVALLLTALSASAAEPATPPVPTDGKVEQLATKARPSIVVITTRGRAGKREGIGTGFVVGEGLIATNHHVIGEGRPLVVETAAGKKLEVTSIQAHDRRQDLALLKVEGKGLPALPLGDPKTLKDGQPVVAMGNPQGLRHSVVAGVVSGRREQEGQSMIQLAIPIEPGNSGGPLLDLHGRVHGILTSKSLVTPNLGFAVPSSALEPLIRKPNPVPYKAWLTIGVLDADEWEVIGSASWRQRAGRIIAEGEGSGIGRRGLCLTRQQPPEVPFEVLVTVKLEDEAGAAGLIWHADGKDSHYGFYPSAGQLRFTRFTGPDVFSWKVLRQEASPHYRPGEWNTLKVRVEKEKMRCFVNDELVFEVVDADLTGGRVGLAKFRDTVAQFKQFRVAPQLPPSRIPDAVSARISKSIEKLPAKGTLPASVVAKLSPEGPAGLAALQNKARELELQAAQLRRLAQAVHQRSVLDQLHRLFQDKEEQIDLLHAALLLAKLDNEEVDVDSYRAEIDRMARKLSERLPKEADESKRLTTLNQYLFGERGFHGSRRDYYNRSNSYLSEVIDDREGLPITLSVLYIELGRRIGLKMEGVGLPGHFVVRHLLAKGEGQLIDVFEGGKTMSKEEAGRKVKEITGEVLEEASLAGVSKKAILVRMFHNLLHLAQNQRDGDGMLRYLEGILLLEPASVHDRAVRIGLLMQKGDKDAVLKDIDWLLEKEPEGVDLDRLRELRRSLMKPEK